MWQKEEEGEEEDEESGELSGWLNRVLVYGDTSRKTRVNDSLPKGDSVLKNSVQWLKIQAWVRKKTNWKLQPFFPLRKNFRLNGMDWADTTSVIVYEVTEVRILSIKYYIGTKVWSGICHFWKLNKKL